MSSTSREPDGDAQSWECSWDDHRRRQMQRWARLPLSEKLQWLEEAHELVLALEAARQAARVPQAPIPKDP